MTDSRFDAQWAISGSFCVRKRSHFMLILYYTRLSIYNKYAKIYNQVAYGPNWKFKADLLAKYLDGVFQRYAKRKVKEILDVGCGTGVPAIALGELGYRVTGIDISPVMLGIAKQHSQHLSNVKFIKLDWNKLSKEKLGKRFDAIIYRGASIEHNESIRKVVELFRNFYRLLKKGGVIYVTLRNWETKFPQIKRRPIEFASDHPICVGSQIYIPIYRYMWKNSNLIVDFIFISFNTSQSNGCSKKIFRTKVLGITQELFMKIIENFNFKEVHKLHAKEKMMGNKHKVYLLVK